LRDAILVLSEWIHENLTECDQRWLTGESETLRQALPLSCENCVVRRETHASPTPPTHERSPTLQERQNPTMHDDAIVCVRVKGRTG
jgi:hypothetical protein